MKLSLGTKSVATGVLIFLVVLVTEYASGTRIQQLFQFEFKLAKSYLTSIAAFLFIGFGLFHLIKTRTYDKN